VRLGVVVKTNFTQLGRYTHREDRHIKMTIVVRPCARYNSHYKRYDYIYCNSYQLQQITVYGAMSKIYNNAQSHKQ